MKATSGIGGLIAGFGLELIAFPEGAVVGEVAQSAIDGLLFMCGPLYWLIVLVSVGFMTMYQLSESRHAEILKALRVRRGS
jgi:Na+/melibiose symporter-like transporter